MDFDPGEDEDFRFVELSYGEICIQHLEQQWETTRVQWIVCKYYFAGAFNLTHDSFVSFERICVYSGARL